MTNFDMLAGAHCLDFVNTADGDLALPGWTERLGSYADLVEWGLQAEIVDADVAHFILEEATSHPDEAEAALERARALRVTLYTLFTNQAGGKPLNLTDFNYWLLEGQPQIVKNGNIHWQCGLNEPLLDRVLWGVVDATSELLTSPQVDLIRQCAGDTCGWLFLDTSRNHSRRWCDMGSCGNRAKAKAHYHRSKNTAADND